MDIAINHTSKARGATHELRRLNPALKGGRKWELVTYFVATNAVPADMQDYAVQNNLATAREFQRSHVRIQKAA